MGGVKAAIGGWIYSFWFLKSAFCCVALYYIGKLCFKHPFLIFTITFFISQVIFVFQINLMYPCFVFGVIIHKYIKLIRQNALLISLTSGIIFLTMLLFWDASFWLYPHKQIRIGLHDNIECYYFIGCRMVIGLFGTLLFISLFLYLSSIFRLPKFVKSLISLGQDTLGIYLLQTFLLEMLLPKILNLDNMDFIWFNFIVTPIISLFIMVLCITILHFIKKSNLLSLILLGKK